MAIANPILLATDFSAGSAHAEVFSAILGQALGARVVVLYVDVLHASRVDDEDESDVADEDTHVEGAHSRRIIGEHMAEIEARLRGRSIEVETILRHSLAIAPVIVDVAAEIDAGVIVAGTHGIRGMRRFLLGSVSDELLRTAPFPLCLVPEDTNLEPGHVNRILVPVKFSPSTPYQLDRATALASAFGAEVLLLHVEEPLRMSNLLPGIGTLSDLVPALSVEIDTELEKRAKVLQDGGILTKTLVIDGKAGAQVVDVAESEGCDLILIARHGTSNVERVLLGSVTERITRTASTPILIYPDPRV